MVKSRKTPNDRDSGSRSNDKVEVNSEGFVVAAKGKPGRPKTKTGPGRKPKGKHVEPVRKMVNGKMMKRAVGVPKKVKTGKPGRPKKEYIWVEANDE